jgi:hypothetical protein
MKNQKTTNQTFILFFTSLLILMIVLPQITYAQWTQLRDGSVAYDGIVRTGALKANKSISVFDNGPTFGDTFVEFALKDELPQPGHATFYTKLDRWAGRFTWQINSPTGYIDILRLEGSPSSNTPAILRLDGELRAELVRVVQNAWADYVFDSDFKLRPLSEVASFIQKNKHLPDVPSQVEIQKNGLNIGEMQKIQMQKIEELTLYIIEQNKRIENLEKQITALQKK